jgi:NAD(P)-dependent dehydrogenase (short-subunit alcohol dehydrogenase family)
VSELNGRTAIVTGGGSGIGHAIASALAGAGATVAILDSNAEAASSAAAELRGIALPADVSDPAQVQHQVIQAVGQTGRLDILVNNAAIRHIAGFGEYPLESWRRTLDVNLTGAFICAQAVIPHMQLGGKGKIVNIASIAGDLAVANRVAYTVSKAGVMQLTRTIAYELGSSGIYCNAIAPGIIETPLTKSYFEDEAFSRLIRDNTPMRRWGQPEEIAKPVLFLCSDASDFVNGDTLYVDGGWSTGKGY